MQATTFDVGQILFADKYDITDKITVRQCTVGDIFKLGEERYFHVLSTLTAIPSDAKSVLWDMGIDWEEISDLEFFSLMVKTLSKEETEIFIPNVDFSKFSLYRRNDDEVIFADKENCITIDKLVHKKILDALCAIHKIEKKVHKASNKITKEWLIEEDRDNRKINATKEFKGTLVPLVSAMCNREGFKYNYSTVRDLPFGQFMDSAARIQIIVSTDHLINGMYSGNIDTKKINKKQLDWTREM